MKSRVIALLHGTAFDALPLQVGPSEGVGHPNMHAPGDGPVGVNGGSGTGMRGLGRAMDGPGRGLYGPGGAIAGPGGNTNRALTMPPPGLPVGRWQPQGSVPGWSMLQHLWPQLHLSCMNIVACCQVNQCDAACKLS